MEFHPQLPSASLIVSRCFRHVFLINFSSRVCPAKSIDKFIRLYDFIGYRHGRRSAGKGGTKWEPYLDNLRCRPGSLRCVTGLLKVVAGQAIDPASTGAQVVFVQDARADTHLLCSAARPIIQLRLSNGAYQLPATPGARLSCIAFCLALPLALLPFHCVAFFFRSSL